MEEKIRSGKWHHKIKDIGNKSGETYRTRYVVDLDVAPLITEIRIYADSKGKCHIPEEYRSDVVYGSNVKAMAAVLYSEGVMSNDRIAAFQNAISGDEMELSEGSVYHFCENLLAKCSKSVANLEEELLNQTVVSTDATTVTLNAKQAYIRNFSTKEAVLYRAMKEKNLDTMHKIRFLEKFTGILIVVRHFFIAGDDAVAANKNIHKENTVPTVCCKKTARFFLV